MLGTIVNCMAVLAGGAIGLLLKKGIPERISRTLMDGVALVVLYIGIKGIMEGNKILVIILSVFLGGVLGSLIDIDKGMNRLGDFAQKKLSRETGGMKFSEGFVSASLLFCIGAMAVVGSLQSGLTGNHETLFAKALIDGVTAVILASTLGAGVLLSAVPVLLYQGLITCLAQVLSPVLATDIVNEMNCVGSLLIIGISLNMLKLTKLKLANFLPAIFLPILLCHIF